ncbi:MAG TPA: DUF3883 domain-containing protein, partial [Methylobacter sp.]
GWYKNAIVFRHFQSFITPSKKHTENRIDGYRYSAKASDAVLLPVDRRIFEIPRGKGGMGQSNVWYADNDIAPKWLASVRKLIDDGENLPTRKKSKATPDQAQKVLVEKSAVAVVWGYYQSLGYEISSVEQDNLGWDLEAVSGSIKLQIEVKGLSGKAVTAELTPNEYRIFSENRLNYRLCVVTNSLAEPTLYVFHFNLPSQSWTNELSEDLEVLNIKQKVSASVSLI